MPYSGCASCAPRAGRALGAAPPRVNSARAPRGGPGVTTLDTGCASNPPHSAHVGRRAQGGARLLQGALSESTQPQMRSLQTARLNPAHVLECPIGQVEVVDVAAAGRVGAGLRARPPGVRPAPCLASSWSSHTSWQLDCSQDRLVLFRGSQVPCLGSGSAGLDILHIAPAKVTTSHSKHHTFTRRLQRTQTSWQCIRLMRGRHPLHGPAASIAAPRAAAQRPQRSPMRPDVWHRSTGACCSDPPPGHAAPITWRQSRSTSSAKAGHSDAAPAAWTRCPRRPSTARRGNCR